MGVQGVEDRRHGSGGRVPAAVVVTQALGPDGPGGLVDILLRRVQTGLRLLRANNLEHGHVIAHHGDAELGGQGQPLLLQQPCQLVRRAAGAAPAGHHRIDILIPIARQLQLLHKKAENAGQAPEVDGEHEADALLPGYVVAVAAAADGVPEEHRPVAGGGGDALGGVLAVAGGGKVKDHFDNSF